jgi:putative transport protein
LIGKTAGELENMFPERVSADRIKRDGKVFDLTLDEVIKSGDIVAIVSSHRDQFLKAESIIGPEVDDEDVVGLVGEIMKVCVLAEEAEGKTIGELAADKRSHGCYLKRITRQGQELPITMKTVVHKCDVMQLAGTRENVEKAAKMLGYAERSTGATDLILVGLGCVFGTLLGLLMVRVGGVPITLGVGGGVLVAGLICGWLRSVHPTFGQIPTGAQWIFTDFGLNLFIACVGFVAGPRAVHALQTTGGTLFFAGVILTLTPHILGTIFGKYVLRMNPLILFGALTGAGTATPSLNVLKDESNSSMPVLGYTVPYAFANVILTVWGTVIVNVM